MGESYAEPEGGQAGIDLFTYEGRRMSFRSWRLVGSYCPVTRLYDQVRNSTVARSIYAGVSRTCLHTITSIWAKQSSSSLTGSSPPASDLCLSGPAASIRSSGHRERPSGQ